MKAQGWVTIAACFWSASLAMSQNEAVSTPASREALLKNLAAMLTSATGVEAQFAKVKDPLHPPESDLIDPSMITGKKPAELSARQMPEADLLQLLAAKIHPTGSGEIGGEPFLLLTEKRLKIGDKIPVVQDGVEYGLEIVSIESNRVRLRLHSQEIVRPIK